MKSIFSFKAHPKLINSNAITAIEADFVEFEEGWVLFYEDLGWIHPILKTRPADKRLVYGIHKEHCYDLRETLNDNGDS